MIQLNRAAASRESAFRHMRDAAGEVGFARGDNEVIAMIDDAGREDDVAQIHLVFDRPGQLGVRPRAAACGSVATTLLGSSRSSSDQ